LQSLQAYLASGNLKEYAIVVHGIKGSSYGIMAQEVGKQAERLERAAKANDMETVKAEHAAFQQTAEALLGNIEQTLAHASDAGQKPLADDPDPSLLREVRDACAAFNMDRADQAMKQLEAFHYKSGEQLVAWLRERINAMAFEDIAHMDVPDGHS
jgi:HPt (histidine-containing phosphotransfer) domain-containing protein